MTGGLLSVVHATKRYDGSQSDALSDVTFDVAPGEVCCIIGRNGAGKSTLMSSVVGLTRLTDGQVTLGGSSLPTSPELRRRVGFAAQSEALYPLLSGRQNLTTFGRLAGFDRTEIERRISDLAPRLSLDSFLDRPVRQLSGGERRRVHVAAALIADVDVVMLDEPTAGVDPVTRADVLQLASSVAAGGAIVLYSTHYLQEVEQLDGQVVMLEQGRVVAQGTVSHLLARHASSVVRMRFSREVEVAGLPWEVRWEDLVLTVSLASPDEDLPRLLHHLGDATVHLQSLDVVEPTLDRVFMDLTGAGLSPGTGEIAS